MSVVHIPRAEGRISGFPVPPNRFDGQSIGLAVSIDERISDFSSVVSTLRRAANAQGTPIVGELRMASGERVFGMRMPADPAQLFIQIGLRPDDVRRSMNAVDLRDRGEVFSRFEAGARHYDEAGEGLFAPRELTWNVRGRIITQRMFGRTIETPDGPLADFGRNEDGRRNDAGERAPLFGKASTPQDWSIIARSVIARIDRDRIERISGRDMLNLYDAALGETGAISKDAFRELIEEEMAGSIAARNAQGRPTAHRFSTALPAHEDRGGTRLVLAQFSTPPAIGQIAAEYLKPNGKVVLEPSIGNGVLSAPTAQYGGLVMGLELDEARAARATRALNRGESMSIVKVGDAFEPQSYPSSPAHPEGLYDAALINPPYKRLANEEDDTTKRQVYLRSLDVNLTTNYAELLVAAQAVDRIRPGGAAVLVMPANMLDPTMVMPKQRQTHNMLNMAFERVEAVALDASLYRAMGANFPTVVYFCEGKREQGNVPEMGQLPAMLPASYPIAASYSDFFQAADQIIARSQVEVLSEAEAENNRVAFAAARAGAPVIQITQPEPAPAAGQGAGEPVARPDPQPEPPIATPEPPVGGAGPSSGVSGPSGSGGAGSPSGGASGPAGGSGGAGGGRPTAPVQPDPIVPPKTEPDPEPEPDPVAPAPVEPEPFSAPPKEDELALPANYHVLDNFDDDALTVSYTPFTPKSAGSVVIERALEGATYAALRHVVSHKGDLGRYVASKLNYDPEYLLSDQGPLNGAQIDALALSFFNREQKRATIVGDLMGVGKGRTMAAHAYNGLLEGRAVLMMSNKPHLFRDLAVRDLKAISGRDFKDLLESKVARPFIMNSTEEAALTEKDGKTVVFQTMAAERNMAKEKGEVSQDYNLVMSSYSQFQTAAGVWKADAITEWIKEAARRNPENPPVLLLDEVHEAAGPDSRTGIIMRRMLDEAEKVGAEIVFSSATSMKSGKNIGIYRQALPETGLSIEQLTGIIEQNPFAMQEVLSTEMARSGALIQRKLSSAGVRRDMRLLADVDPEKLDEARVMTDDLAEFLREAISMGQDIKEAAIRQAKSQFGGLLSGSSIENKMTVDTVSPAASFDAISRYYLISMKARFAEDLLREITAAGEKATVLQEFTGDSVTEFLLETNGYNPRSALPKEGVVVNEHPNIGHVVKRMAERMLEVKGTDAMGNAIGFKVQGFDGWLADFTERVNGSGFEKWRVNSFDAVREACENLGMTFEDISGRKFEIMTEGDKVIVRNREIPTKMAVADRFNNGKTDVLMLTSAAATGMSLQNSPTEGVDLRTRAMLFLSFLKNIASHTQAEGRIDRTGQLTPPHYVIPNTGFVADDRLASLFNRGSRNLSSMTSGSRENDRTIEEAVDLLNPVGDMAVRAVLRQNPDLAETLGIPVGKSGEIDAGDLGRKLLGRAFILGATESQDVLADVDLMAKTILQDLEAQGENPLKIGRYDWKAEIETIEVLHDGDENSLSLADQPLSLVEIRRQEQREVMAARGVIERITETAQKAETSFQTIEEQFRISAAMKPRKMHYQADAWDFDHKLFDGLAGRQSMEGKLVNDAAFEMETPAVVLNALQRAFANERLMLVRMQGKPNNYEPNSDEFKELIEKAADGLRKKYQPRDEHGRVDQHTLEGKRLLADEEGKQIIDFLNQRGADGKPRKEVESLERAVRMTMRRTEQVHRLMEFSKVVEPGRLISINTKALDSMVAGRLGELYRQAEFSEEDRMGQWIPAVVISAKIDSDSPTTLSKNNMRIFVPGEAGAFQVSFSELRSNLAFRGGEQENAVETFRAFADDAYRQLVSGSESAATVMKEWLGENVHRFSGIIKEYSQAARYANDAEDEAQLTRIVDKEGRQGAGAKLFTDISECLPRGFVTRKRFGLMGNLFTAMSAVTASNSREKNLGEKAVITDRDGNNVNVILLNESGQKNAVERVKQKEKSRSHPRPDLRGSREAIMAEIELNLLVLSRGYQNIFSRTRELRADEQQTLNSALGKMFPDTFGTPAGQAYLNRNGGDVLHRLMAKLKSDVTYPASTLLGGDLWRSISDEQSRKVKESKGRMQFEAPASYTVMNRGGDGPEGMVSVTSTLSALTIARGLSTLDDRQAVLMYGDDGLRLVMRKTHPLAQSGEFSDLVQNANETIYLDGSSAKMTRGTMAFTATKDNEQALARVAEFVAKASAGSESVPLGGGFSRNIHAAAVAVADEFKKEQEKALRAEKQREADPQPSTRDMDAAPDQPPPRVSMGLGS
ncbi:strawberry notch-like NTP hydrolase domain-containing protein [Pseudogemmobacter faecipullorum]|uniref:Strawberry notch family protein n=1 Tax=Pseudogemmobacter faecipullorum TaxID=2755041 RepID=A0ABS8CQP9_9RHOB|nr:strawberry notch family protein [Pseudogemmobacter faecipullorum]MCB5411721.1 strawberry notch family protein [Pseudogemmobacter faecipullorum]